jgi:putative aldouronate transport system permease protein
MRSTTGERLFSVLNTVFLVLFAMAMIYPFWDVFRLSITSPGESGRMGFRLWPREVWWGGYLEVLQNRYIWSGYWNTLIRVVVGMAVQMVLTVFCAYPLARRSFPHRPFWTLVIVFTMFFSGGLIPQYILVRTLGMDNTLWALVLPPAINTFAMLIMRNFFMSLPESLEESARIDGAGDLRVLRSIILPLSMPILMTVLLWGIVWHWNAWFDCLIYIRDGRRFVLQVILRKIIIDASPQFTPETVLVDRQVKASGEVVKAGTIIVSTVPILLVYPFIQKYFITGVMVGSLKG